MSCNIVRQPFKSFIASNPSCSSATGCRASSKHNALLMPRITRDENLDVIGDPVGTLKFRRLGPTTSETYQIRARKGGFLTASSPVNKWVCGLRRQEDPGRNLQSRSSGFIATYAQVGHIFRGSTLTVKRNTSVFTARNLHKTTSSIHSRSCDTCRNSCLLAWCILYPYNTLMQIDSEGRETVNAMSISFPFIVTGRTKASSFATRLDSWCPVR